MGWSNTINCHLTCFSVHFCTTHFILPSWLPLTPEFMCQKFTSNFFFFSLFSRSLSTESSYLFSKRIFMSLSAACLDVPFLLRLSSSRCMSQKSCVGLLIFTSRGLARNQLTLNCTAPEVQTTEWQQPYWGLYCFLIDCCIGPYWLLCCFVLTVVLLHTDCRIASYWLSYCFILTVVLLHIDCRIASYWLSYCFILTVVLLHIDCRIVSYWLSYCFILTVVLLHISIWKFHSRHPTGCCTVMVTRPLFMSRFSASTHPHNF
jgi:hypothetical protein